MRLSADLLLRLAPVFSVRESSNWIAFARIVIVEVGIFVVGIYTPLKVRGFGLSPGEVFDLNADLADSKRRLSLSDLAVSR